MKRKHHSVLLICIGGLALIATACPPDPGPVTPATPTWTGNHVGSTASGGSTQLAAALGTTADWYVEFTAVSDNTASGVVSMYPRVGVNGDDLGTPQVVQAGVLGLGGGFVSDHTVITGSTPTSGGLAAVWRESGGTWTEAGTIDSSPDGAIRGLSDEVVAMTRFDSGTVQIYKLIVSGATVTPTLSQTISVPATWGSGYTQAFGNALSLDGDVLAIGSRDFTNSGPGKVAVYRYVGGTYVFETDVSDGGKNFGVSVAIDDQGTSERLAVGSYADIDPSHVNTFVSAAAVWGPESTINRPASVPDLDSGMNFGDRVVLDGDLMVISSAKEALPPTALSEARSLQTNSVFHRSGATWSLEATLRPAASPLDTVDLNRGLINPLISGSHIVGTSFVGLVPPPGCGFFCFALRFEAWRFDRSPA